MTCSVGINEYASQNSVLIYPNPASTIININIENFSNSETAITMYDVTGRIVKNVSTTEKSLSIDRGDLRSGIYFVQVLIADKVLTKKIVLE